MRALCSWCQAEGSPAYLGEREPLENPTDTFGVCPRHLAAVLTAPEGTYLEIGNINVGWKAEFDPSWIIFGNRRIIGLAHYEAEHLRGALELMQRTLTKYPWGRVVSHKYPLEQINEAFTEQDKGHVTRAAIVPN